MVGLWPQVMLLQRRQGDWSEVVQFARMWFLGDRDDAGCLPQLWDPPLSQAQVEDALQRLCQDFYTIFQRMYLFHLDQLTVFHLQMLSLVVLSVCSFSILHANNLEPPVLLDHNTIE